MSPVPPQVDKVLAIIRRIPDGDLISSRELAAAMNLTELRGLTLNHKVLKEFRQTVGRKLYWGNTRTIGMLREKLAGNEGSNETE